MTKGDLMDGLREIFGCEVSTGFNNSPVLHFYLESESSFAIGFLTLKKVSELFDTDHIDVNNWSKSSGCET